VDQAIEILENLSNKQTQNEQIFTLLASAHQAVGDTGKSLETVLRASNHFLTVKISF